MSKINNGLTQGFTPESFGATKAKQTSRLDAIDQDIKADALKKDTVVATKATSNWKPVFFDASGVDNTVSSDSLISSNALSDFNKSITDSIKSAGNKITPQNASSIFQKQEELRKILSNPNIKTLKEAESLNDLLPALVRQLSTSGLLTGETREQLDKVMMSSIDKLGKSFGIELKPLVINGEILGITVKNNGKLTEDQKKCIKTANDLFLQTEQVKSVKSDKLSQQDLFLMGLREAVLRKIALDMMPDEKVQDNSPPPTYTDMELTANTVKSIDAMLASTRDLPTGMLSDMEKMVDSIQKSDMNSLFKDAKGTVNYTEINIEEQKLKLINDLKDQIKTQIRNTGNQTVDSAFKELPKLTQELKNQIKSLNLGNTQGVDNIIDNIEKQIREKKTTTLNSLFDQLDKKIDELGPQVKTTPTANTSSVENTTDQVDKSTLKSARMMTKSAEIVSQSTSNLNAPTNANIPDSSVVKGPYDMLLDAIKGMPHDVNDKIGDVINAYSTAMNMVQPNLPKLPFPIKLPVPLSYDDGKGTKIVIPAGSEIINKNGEYSIKSNGLLMQSGNVLINSKESSIKIGNAWDKLSIAQLGVQTSDNDSLIKGFEAQINRKDNSAFINADKTAIDLTNGKVDLTDATLIRNADSMKLSADSFLYQKDNNLVDISGFQMGQTKVNGISELSVGSEKLKILTDQMAINSTSMTLTTTKDANSPANATHIIVENLNLHKGDATIQAQKAVIDIVTNADNSSSMNIASDNAAYFTDKTKLELNGHSNISINEDPSGHLSNINTHADNITYKDPNGFLKADNGSLGINYGPNGKVKDISGEVQKFNFKNQSSDINADNSKFNLVYNDNGQLQNLAAHTDKFNYKGDSGILDVTSGNVGLNFWDNGKLKAFNADGSVDWAGKTGEKFKAQDSSLNVNCYDSGKIKDIATKTGNLQFSNTKGDNLNVVNGASSATFDQNGVLNTLNGSVEKMTYKGSKGDSFVGAGLDLSVKNGPNGLESLAAKAGSIDYKGVKGEKFGLVNGNLEISRDSQGSLSNIKGAVEKVTYTGIRGDSFTGSGLDLNIKNGPNGLENLAVKAGELGYTGIKGDKYNLTNGSLEISRDPEGYLSGIKGGVEKFTYKGVKGDSFTAAGLGLDVKNGKNGLEKLSMQAGTIDYNGIKGDKFNLTNGSFNLNRDPAGDVTTIQGGIEKLSYVSTKGDSFTAAGMGLDLKTGPKGLEQLGMKVGTVDYIGSKGDKFNLTNGTFNLNRDPVGDITTIQGGVEKLSYVSKKGDSFTAAGMGFDMKTGPQGLEKLGMKVGTVDYIGSKGDKFNLTNGTFDLNRDPAGDITTIQGGVEKLSYVSKKGDSFTAAGMGFDMKTGPQGLEKLGMKVGTVDYIGSKGDKFNLTNGTFDLNRDPVGDITTIQGGVEKLSYVSKKGDSFTAAGMGFDMKTGPQGLEKLGMKVGTVDYIGSKGDKFNLTNGTFDLNRDPAGDITTIKGGIEKLSYVNKKGDSFTAAGMGLDIKTGPQGLEQLAMKVGTVDYIGSKGDKFNLTNGTFNINRDPVGEITTIQGGIDKLSYVGTKGDSFTAAGLGLDVKSGKNGLENLSIKAGTVDYTGIKGDKFNLTNGTFNINRDPSGEMTNIQGGIEKLSYVGTKGESFTAAGLGLDIKSGKNGFESLTMKTGSLDYLGAKGDKFNLTNGSLSITKDPEGYINNVKGDIEKISFTSSKGDVLTANGLGLNVRNGKNGFENLTVSAGKIGYISNKGDLFNLENGSLALTRDPSGNLFNVNGNIENLNLKTVNGQNLTASGINVNVDIDKTGLKTAGVKVGTLDYSQKDIQLNVQNGALNFTNGTNGTVLEASAEKVIANGKWGNLTGEGGKATTLFGPDGNFKSFNLSGNSLTYNGTREDKPINFSMQNFNAGITNGPDGQALNFTGKNINFDFNGNKAYFENIQNIELRNGKDGKVSGFDINLAGKSTFEKDGDLFIGLNNAQAHYKVDGNNLSASFDKLDIAKKSQQLTASLTGGKIENTVDKISVHVDSAEVIKKMEQELKVKIENLDVVVDKTATGGIKGLDLQLGGLEGNLVGMNLMVKTVNGERVRLNVQLSEDGKMLQEAFLQIPTGGEIKIENKDMTLKLGGDQKFIFKQDGHGVYTFRDEGIDIDFASKDAKVKIKGGNAEVKLDANTGDIIIEEITGTKINAQVAGQEINVDIQKMNGFIAQATGVSGSSQGAILRLKPTKDNSEITLEIETKVSGIPVYLKLNNVHDLEASGIISQNQFRVYLGDKSGRGRVELGAGPLKFEGSALEFVGKYNTYEPKRMLSTMSSFMTSDGVYLGAGLSVEGDGVVRWGTQFSGPHGEVAVVLPQANGEHSAPGVIASLGWQGKTGAGTKWSVNANAGLVSGSYLSIEQTQGSASLAGLPLPKQVNIPTTAIAGLDFRREGSKSRFNATVGGFLNPAGLAPKDSQLQENIKYGGYGGLSYRTGNVDIGIMGVANVDRDDKVRPAGMVTLGFRF